MGQSKIVAITYANEKYAKAARLNMRTAKKTGKVDKTILYSPNDIELSFWNNHKEILQQVKGNGYWLWKPYFILATLKKMDEGDVLIYTDAAIIYNDSASKLITAMEQNHTDKMLFLLGKEYTDAKYTKRDAFILMDCDEEKYYETAQVNAAIVVFKKNEENIKFCSEWLQYASDSRILTEIPNTCGKENYPNFLMHRHDQSILSLLSKKYDSIFFMDPSQWGDKSDYADDIKERSQYSCVFNHHRIANANSLLYIFIMQTAIVKKIRYKKFLWEENRKRKNVL